MVPSLSSRGKRYPCFNLTSSDVKSVTEVPNTKEMEVTIEEDENNEVWEEDGKISHGKEDFQAASADATPFIEYYDGIFDNPVESALYFYLSIKMKMEVLGVLEIQQSC